MDLEAANLSDLLNRIALDENEDPRNLPIWFLKSITNNFSDDRHIGSGGFADVYRGQHENGIIIAVKKLNQNVSEMVEVHEKKFMQEVDSLMKVNHKNIVRFLGYCSDTQGEVWKLEGKSIMAEKRQRFLCFEFLPKGSLDKFISDPSKGLDWRTRYQIIRGICDGLHYLHLKKIVHSDLKPANILLDDEMVPKISDFGLARTFDDLQTHIITKNVCGSCRYMAPESFDGVITFHSDIYSLGIMIRDILEGAGPKVDLSVENMLERWSSRLLTSQEGKWLEHVRVCAEIGLQCLDFDQLKRPSMKDIIKKLEELESTYGFIGTDHGLLATPVCAEIGLQCLDFVQLKRPSMKDIIKKLEELESTYGFIGTDHGLLATPLIEDLDVYPQEVCFPWEANRCIECPVTLSNHTDKNVVVWITPSTNQNACSSSGLASPYLWEPQCITSDDKGSSLLRELVAHSSMAIPISQQQQRPLQVHFFDVVMFTLRSRSGFTRWHRQLADREIDPENVSKQIKLLSTVVYQARLSVVTCYKPKCLEVDVTAQNVVTKQSLRRQDLSGICSMDVHPTERWVLLGHLDGKVSIWDYQTLERIKVLLVTDLFDGAGFKRGRICSAKFIGEEQWFAAGDNVGCVHVCTYTTNDKVKEFEVHSGKPVTTLAVQPTDKLLLTAADTSIKLWDWGQGWTCVRVFDSQEHVCHLKVVGPWDTSTFASFLSSDDASVKVWDFLSTDPVATFKFHVESNFNIDSDGHFLATCTKQDTEVKIRDMKTMKRVFTLKTSISRFIDGVFYHPKLPILVAITHTITTERSEEMKILLWDTRSYRLLKTVGFHMDDYRSVQDIVFDGTGDSIRIMARTRDNISIIEI